jgi:thioredoxin-like negative regulator of GroEL
MTTPDKSNGVNVIAGPNDISTHIGGEIKTVVLFEMTTCPFCRMFEERFLDFARSSSGDLNFLRVTLDNPGNPLWARYDIHNVPTVIIFAGGKITSRLDSVPFFGISKKKWAEFCAGFK